MKIVIEIPDHIYEHAKNCSEDSNDEWDAMRAIAKGFPYEERPHGEWEYTGCVNDELQSEFCCSICDFTTYYQYNFCPNCGSDNRKGGEAE